VAVASPGTGCKLLSAVFPSCQKDCDWILPKPGKKIKQKNPKKTKPHTQKNPTKKPQKTPVTNPSAFYSHLIKKYTKQMIIKLPFTTDVSRYKKRRNAAFYKYTGRQIYRANQKKLY